MYLVLQVAKAICDAGGASIQSECDRLVKDKGPVQVGQVAITTGGDLDCYFVIHAVGK